jgi:hypothetical protein
VIALALAASLISVQLVGPRPVLTPRDAPQVVVIVDYRGPGYARNVVVTVTASGGRISRQRGTTCRRSAAGALVCPVRPIAHASTKWLFFLVTRLRSGRPLRVTARARSASAGEAQATLTRPVRARRP